MVFIKSVLKADTSWIERGIKVREREGERERVRGCEYVQFLRAVKCLGLFKTSFIKTSGL